MAYSDKVIEHYENPRNVGSFDKEDPNVGTGLVGAPACGDVMKLQLKINEQGVIEDAKFKTFGCGSAIASSSLATESTRLLALRDRLRQGLQARISDTYVNGSLEHRLPGNLNISFAYVEGEAMLMGLKDIAVSSGSACTSASLEPSYVLRALGVEEELAHTSIRFGLGRFNTEEEVDFVIELVTGKVEKLRELSPLYEMAQAGIDLKSIHWTPH